MMSFLFQPENTTAPCRRLQYTNALNTQETWQHSTLFIKYFMCTFAITFEIEYIETQRYIAAPNECHQTM